MSHSRKDVKGGHPKGGVGFKRWSYMWSQGGKNYAKRFRAKLCRRHARISLRDLDLEPIIEVESEWDDPMDYRFWLDEEDLRIQREYEQDLRDQWEMEEFAREGERDIFDDDPFFDDHVFEDVWDRGYAAGYAAAQASHYRFSKEDHDAF